MKKILLAVTLCFLFSSIKAQELNFEETEKYIQTKLKEFGECCYDANYDLEFKAKPNGDLQFGKSKINFFSLNNKENVSYVDEFGIMIVPTGFRRPTICFMGGGGHILDIEFIRTTTEADLEKIHKALRHLRSLCTKEKDPFDN